MYVQQLNALVPTSFAAHAVDESGQLVEGTVNIWINRLSFREVTREEFQKALDGIETDPEKVGELLVKAISKWDLFADEAGTEMLEITVENIIDRPFDFVMAMSNAAFTVLFPNQQRPANSPGGSEAVKKLASAATTSEAATDSTAQLAS